MSVIAVTWLFASAASVTVRARAAAWSKVKSSYSSPAGSVTLIISIRVIPWYAER